MDCCANRRRVLLLVSADSCRILHLHADSMYTIYLRSTDKEKEKKPLSFNEYISYIFKQVSSSSSHAGHTRMGPTRSQHSPAGAA
jgi:hypothetical protein